MARVLIAGCIGFGNGGDEAIVKAATGDLRETIPEADITVISGNPAQTAAAYGVRAIDWHGPVPIVEAVRDTDLTIVGGGGLFEDYWGFDPDKVLTREYWGLSYYVTPALLSAVYGKPLMLYGVGAGPLMTGLGRKFTKAAGDIAARITVRDPGSKKLFESLGVCADKITVTADPAFGLKPAATPTIPEVGRWMSGRPAIAVCLRNWAFGKEPMFQSETAVEPEQSRSESRIAAALDDLLDEGGRVLFVPFHLSSGSHDDLVVARRVLALLRHREHAAVLAQPCSPAELAGILAQADLVLGMRLHSLIFSLAAQVPFVALEYDPKVGALGELAGLEECTLPFGGVESDVLARRMRHALQQRGRFRELAGPLLGDLRVRARQNAVIAAELLQRGSEMSDSGPEARDLIGRLLLSRLRELDEKHAQLSNAWRESERLRQELQAAEQQAEARAGAFKQQIAGYESKTFGAIVKRALQVVLDLFQFLTPRPLRDAVRKYYLNWFYFRIYPERRPASTAGAAAQLRES